MKTRILAALAFGSMISLLGCSAEAEKAESHQQAAEKPAATATVGEAAPGFTLVDAGGEEHSLSDFAGKYVVLEWINFDCPFVKAHYSSGNIPTLQKEYAEKGVVWLSVCSSAPGKQGHFEGEALHDRITESGSAAAAYLIDADGTVGRMYEAKTTPHMYVIDPDGKLIYAGAIDSKATTDAAVVKSSTNYVAGALEAAMAGEDVPTAMSVPYGCSVKY